MGSYKMLISSLAVGALACTLSVPPVGAQFSYRRTVGDESDHQYQPGGYLALKYRGATIGTPDLTQNSAIGGRFIRAAKLRDSTAIGGSTGIGGSSLQTQAVTAESRPALLQPTSISTGTPLISRPVLDLRFGSSIASPALKTFKVQSPSFGEQDLFGRAPEAFTNSTNWSSPATSSFSSTIDQFQFGQ